MKCFKYCVKFKYIVTKGTCTSTTLADSYKSCALHGLTQTPHRDIP